MERLISRSRTVSLSACLVLTACATAAGLFAAGVAPRSAEAAASSRGLTVYSAPTQQAFIDDNDDEARGDINNPFGTHNDRAAAISNEHSNGPFAGDQAMFAFNLYTDGA